LTWPEREGPIKSMGGPGKTEQAKCRKFTKSLIPLMAYPGETEKCVGMRKGVGPKEPKKPAKREVEM